MGELQYAKRPEQCNARRGPLNRGLGSMGGVDDFHQLRMSAREGTFPRDLGPSEVGPRRALARCRVNMLAPARVAGMQAAKQASSLLPMAHPVLVGNVHVNFNIADTFIEVEASVD